MTTYLQRGVRLSTGVDQMGMPMYTGTMLSGIVEYYDDLDDEYEQYYRVRWEPVLVGNRGWDDELYVSDIRHYTFMGAP